MLAVTPCPLPDTSFLKALTLREGNYTDCFVTEILADVSIHEFIGAFFGSTVLRLERHLLALMSARSSTKDVIAIANGSSDKIALWKMEQRDDTQIILRVANEAIRTWLMVSPTAEGKTHLYFGSAIVPEAQANGEVRLSFLTRRLQGFHLLYSRAVLWSAKKQLLKTRR